MAKPELNFGFRQHKLLKEVWSYWGILLFPQWFFSLSVLRGKNWKSHWKVLSCAPHFHIWERLHGGQWEGKGGWPHFPPDNIKESQGSPSWPQPLAFSLTSGSQGLHQLDTCRSKTLIRCLEYSPHPAWSSIPVQPLTECLTLDKSLNLSNPLYLVYKMRTTNPFLSASEVVVKLKWNV